MLGIHVHQRQQPSSEERRKPSSPAPTTNAAPKRIDTGCGYRLEAAARRVGVSSRFTRER